MTSSNRADVRDFLVTRRGRITPQQAGLTFYGGNRRVPGLRREEVAMLAGVSADYYTRLEKGNLAGVSDSVLDAIANALQLDEAERMHLTDLARTANTSPARAARRNVPAQVRPGIQLILDGMTDTPAFIRNGRLDMLAANTLGRALYSPLFDTPGGTPNLARFRFFDPAARQFYPDFADSARTNVELLRTEAGRDPFNPSLTRLFGELSTRSEEFRALWAAHNVRLHRTGVKHFSPRPSAALTSCSRPWPSKLTKGSPSPPTPPSKAPRHTTGSGSWRAGQPHATSKKSSPPDAPGAE
jgi:transcriptional regulator with XRE-family HTH domain